VRSFVRRDQILRLEQNSFRRGDVVRSGTDADIADGVDL